MSMRTVQALVNHALACSCGAQELQKAQAEQQQLASRASAMASAQRRIVSRLARMPYYSHWAKGVAM